MNLQRNRKQAMTIIDKEHRELLLNGHISVLISHISTEDKRLGACRQKVIVRERRISRQSGKRQGYLTVLRKKL